MSKKKNNYVAPVPEEEQVIFHEEIIEEPVVVEEAPAPKEEPKTVTGTVVGCLKLNVRMQMNSKAEILCVLPVSSKVEVIVDEQHDDWYHVFTASGVEGFCMKKYLQI